MAINNIEFTKLFRDVEVFYSFEMPGLARKAYLDLFNQIGWSAQQLRDAIELVMQSESGYGRIPPAQVFVDRYLEHRRTTVSAQPNERLLNPDERINCCCCNDSGIVNPANIKILRDLSPLFCAGFDVLLQYRCQRQSCYQKIRSGHLTSPSNQLTRNMCDLLHEFLVNQGKIRATQNAGNIAQQTAHRMAEGSLDRAIDHLRKIHRCLKSEDVMERKWAEGALRVAIDQYPERYNIVVKWDVTGVVAYQEGVALELEAAA